MTAEQRKWMGSPGGILIMVVLSGIAQQIAVAAWSAATDPLAEIKKIPKIEERLGNVERGLAAINDTLKRQNVVVRQYRQEPREYHEETAANKPPGPWLTKPGS